MLQIDMAATSSLSNDGIAPANVGELKLLIESGYIDASLDGDDILSKMISTGTDYWGNPLVMQPVPEQAGTVELRSIGPDGKYDRSENSDDIFIQFRTRID